ncbi:uncharacterized protein LOC143879752 [Tasmannia lanceolata]|uniref:uncharacterized protein LOC143879752 n=1 Tax=Tasmannia lanceolata TaxID=3420 RepID=UPI004063C05F
MDTHKRKRKSRDTASSPPHLPNHHNHHHIFPQMLAAFANIQTLYAQSLIKRLQKIHLAFIIENPLSLQQILPNALLSLLPLLLNPEYHKIAMRSAEIVGAAALCSLEANERIACDKEIIDGLVTALASGMKPVVMAAVNAVLDLSTTSIGRERLLESRALEKLLSLFCQVATSSTESVSCCIMENGSNTFSMMGFIEDNFPVLVLNAVITLINSCTEEYLANFRGELASTFLIYLKELWFELHGSTSPSKVANCCREISSFCSNMKIHDLAETIFRLSMNHDQHTTCTFHAVKRSLFGGIDSDFEHFMLNYWEDKPLLLNRTLKTMEEDDIFSPLVLSLNCKTIDAILDIIVGGLVSCPPITSDELDIVSFLKEVKGGLGYPIIYGQDIRVVKTVESISESTKEHLKKEVHFFKDFVGSRNIKSSGSRDICHLQKLKEAFQKGFTLALRGMEFRSQKIASIADGLAMLTGQPSVGANIYLTPPKSQGLARHYDDHCVFVCQLIGEKQWTVFPRSSVLLPRLYEPLSMVVPEGDSDACEGKQFLLKEGDILYIPRGCPHEAHTVSYDGESQIDECAGFSLHLTLGVEVEPPFEWEGFAHVALHCWSQKLTARHPIDSVFSILEVTSINLLHVAIKLIGDRDPTFRKACMVAAFSLPFDAQGKQRMHALDLNQRATFSYIINRINVGSSFLDAFNTVQATVDEKDDDDLFQWMRWLRNLTLEGDMNEEMDLDNPVKAFKDLVLLYNGRVEEAETDFVQIKFEFCRDVIFEDVCRSYEVLQKKYKKTRKQYMNGMLSLHCTK